MSTRILRFILGLTGSVALGLQLPTLQADSAVLTSVADTTLIETAPDYNLGGALIVNAGTTQNFTRNRGLFRFDPTGQIPSGSHITKVDFVVVISGQPKDGYTSSSFGLHRVLKPWGEGDKESPDTVHPGQGAPATVGEATWNYRFAFTTNTWAVPGGAATNDFAPEISAETFIYGFGDSPYTFLSTPALVADVQSWVDDPATNFGWMLICRSEEANFTARRFASREDAGNAPQLLIEYVPPPQIDLITVTNGQLNLTFAAQAGQSYGVEFRDSLSALTNWLTFTNLVAQPYATNVTVFDSVADQQRFYRLRLP